MQDNAAKSSKSRNKGLGKGNASNKTMARENKALAHLGQNWVKRNNTVLAFENLNINYAWDEQEAAAMAEMSNQGQTVEEIAKQLKRPEMDVRIMLVSLALDNQVDWLPYDL